MDKALAADARQRKEIATLSKAAGALALTLGVPQCHAVWVRSDVGEDGEFVNTIRASVRPGFEDVVDLPVMFQGYVIHAEKWPEDS